MTAGSVRGKCTAPQAGSTQRRTCPASALSVGAPQTQQVVLDDAVAREAVEELGARLRIDEAIAVDRPDVGGGPILGPAEDQTQVRIGGERRGVVVGAADEADVHTFAQAVEKAREGFVGIEHRTEDEIEKLRSALEQEVEAAEDKQHTADDTVDQLLKRH